LGASCSFVWTEQVVSSLCNPYCHIGSHIGSKIGKIFPLKKKTTRPP
jgi:hypothetical protein